ncbi:MAG: maltose alpha-D-glucosyltransferase [Gammaproteobacteria bacterium]|nr:maltose alpha-D-glucosyltransferase [Gammaproteobacteria bacterium]
MKAVANAHGGAIAYVDDPQWYKDAIIYQLHVKSFFDANNDGIGDFEGLISKLDYISSLGVNAIWLLPFYPSPRRDDGYDIADYRAVHPDYGNMKIVKRFLAAAHARGLRVITELVINHTSDQHPWFQRARRARAGSAARNYYVWSNSDQQYAGTRIIFLDSEVSNWTWDPVANAYFWHRFYSHQPDLNFDNPQVLKAVLGVLRFWLELGVDGLRLDAVPYLVEREGTSNENLPETHAILKRIRAEIDAAFPGRMLLAEANQWPEDTQLYFGNNDECHMAFHFPLMPRMYMALAQEDRFPITDILRQTPDIPEQCQWAIFLRNHDELTLEMVTDRERDYLWQKYATDPRARINLGIRRRLAPLLEYDRRRVELLNSLLLSMPGTPVIYYGDEIFMGDNIYLGDRDGVRTPMQWSPDRNGGFSRADPPRLVLPPIMDSLSGFASVNVEAQSRDPHSLLNWMRRMLEIRKRQKVFGRGSLKLLTPANRRVLAYLRSSAEVANAVIPGTAAETVLCVANVARSAQAVELDLSAFAGRVPVEMTGGATFPPIGRLPYLLTLPPYGFYWFLLAENSAMPAWHVPYPEPMPDLLTLVLPDGIQGLLSVPILQRLEYDILPAYLPMRRWFATKNETLQSARLVEACMMEDKTASIVLTEVAVKSDSGTVRYLLPIGLIDEAAISGPLPEQLALARTRRGKHLGYLTDAFALKEFGNLLVRLLRKQACLPARDGEVRFCLANACRSLPSVDDADVRWIGVEQSNSSLVVGNAVIIKIIRRVVGGQHPEAEMSRELTARGFANTAPMLGEIVRVDKDGVPHVWAIAQGYIHNQGDGWSWMQSLIERLRQTTLIAVDDGVLLDRSLLQREISEFAGIIGRRLSEMHGVLAAPSDNPDFATEIAGQEQCGRWTRSVQEQIDAALTVLAQTQNWTEAWQVDASNALVQARAFLHGSVQRLAASGQGSLCCRIHGDMHLGQVLVAQQDAYLIDFEGEPARTLEERRGKNSPQRDVAGMLRSLDYAIAKAGEGASAAFNALLTESGNAIHAAFMHSYRQSANEWEVSGPDTADSLVELFLLEKVAYEIVYEAANRPAWLPVPLQGLVKLAERLGLSSVAGWEPGRPAVAAQRRIL